MSTKKKLYTLLVDDHDVNIVKRQYIMENILHKLNIVYDYVDKLDDLTHLINQKLDLLVEKAKKRITILHQIMILLYSFEIVGRLFFP